MHVIEPSKSHSLWWCEMMGYSKDKPCERTNANPIFGAYQDIPVYYTLPSFVRSFGLCSMLASVLIRAHLTLNGVLAS